MTSRKRSTYLSSMYDKHRTIMRLKWLCSEYQLNLEVEVSRKKQQACEVATIKPYLVANGPVFAVEAVVASVQLPELSQHDMSIMRSLLLRLLQERIGQGGRAAFYTSMTITRPGLRFIVRASRCFQDQPWFDFVRVLYVDGAFACRVLALCTLPQGGQSRHYAVVERYTSHHHPFDSPDLMFREPVIKLPLVSPDRNQATRFGLVDHVNIEGPLWVTPASSNALKGALWVLVN